MDGDKTVYWQGVNKIESGTLLLESSNGDWYVRLTSGKVVLVNEKSFLDVRQ